LAAKSFKIEGSDAHISWLTIERELPLEVNLKLGEVARLVVLYNFISNLFLLVLYYWNLHCLLAVCPLSLWYHTETQLIYVGVQQSSKEGISEELVSCLVNIIGKLVHGKTLKVLNLRERLAASLYLSFVFLRRFKILQTM